MDAGEDTLFNDFIGSLGLFVGWLVGFPLLRIATFRTGVLPRWCGLLLIVLFSLLRTGVIWNGLVWLALGYALWTRRAWQPSSLLRR
jgi:hypothetical protein